MMYLEYELDKNKLEVALIKQAQNKNK